MASYQRRQRSQRGRDGPAEVVLVEHLKGAFNNVWVAANSISSTHLPLLSARVGPNGRWVDEILINKVTHRYFILLQFLLPACAGV